MNEKNMLLTDELTPKQQQEMKAVCDEAIKKYGETAFNIGVLLSNMTGMVAALVNAEGPIARAKAEVMARSVVREAISAMAYMTKTQPRDVVAVSTMLHDFEQVVGQEIEQDNMPTEAFADEAKALLAKAAQVQP